MIKFTVLLLLFICIILKQQLYINFVEVNSDSKILLKNIIKSYIFNFRNKNEIKFKTGHTIGHTIEKKNLVDFYLQNIITFTDRDKESIYFYINYIKKQYKKYSLITHSKWNFIKISYKLEGSMPFTLDNYIFLSDRLLTKIYSDKVTNKNLLNNCEMFIHEKIHIIQRNNQPIFNTLYTTYFKTIYCNNLIIKNEWKNKIMSNPDGLNINWIYKWNNNYYLPLLVIEKNSLEQYVIKLIKNKDTYTTTEEFKLITNFVPFMYFPLNASYYHPNEICAYIVSKYIINKETINKKIIKNIQQLSQMFEII